MALAVVSAGAQLTDSKIGFREPETVSRDRRFFYCSVKDSVLYVVSTSSSQALLKLYLQD